MSVKQATQPYLETYCAAAEQRLAALARRPLTDTERTQLRTVAAARYADTPACISNLHLDKQVNTSLGLLASWITTRQPAPCIVTGHGTLFRQHQEYHSIMGDMLDYLMKTRKVAKNQMFDLMRAGRSPDDAEVKALDQRQKIMKLLSNSWYGAFGEAGFHFYNEALGPAVTVCGAH